jgi:hypothetical protein
MGYGDNEPPALRATPYAQTLMVPNHIDLLVLTFVSWDVIKLDWSVDGRGLPRVEFDAGSTSISFTLQDIVSGGFYTMSAQGCAKAVDGSTTYCSPTSRPINVTASTNTDSLRGFLDGSGLTVGNNFSVRSALRQAGRSGSWRTIMGV